MTFERCDFRRGEGFIGSLALLQSTCTFIDCKFEDGKLELDGAISMLESILNCIRCSMTNNQASGDAGGMKGPLCVCLQVCY